MKKLIAVICTLAILLSLVPLLPPRAAALDTENGAYQVGYARVDINPYVVEDDPSSGLMALPLAGLGDDWDRLSNDTLLDDNGDGIVDCNDGLKATCISITDANGGLVRVIGTLNMYGGRIVDGEAASFTGSYLSGGTVQTIDRTGGGGNITVRGTLNLYGGEITGGSTKLITGTVDEEGNYSETIVEQDGLGHCVRVVAGGQVNLFGTAAVDATCTTDGSITKICKSCGDIQTETITAPGHRYEAVVTAPTCTEGGFTTYTCACGDSYTADEVAAWGHSYDVNVVAPDCVIPGTTYDADTGRYIAHSQGIHAKYLGDTVYLAVYAKLADGTYAYCASQSTKGGTIADLAMATAVYGYHAKQYFD